MAIELGVSTDPQSNQKRDPGDRGEERGALPSRQLREARVSALATPLLMGGTIMSSMRDREYDQSPAGYIRAADGRLRRSPVIFSAQRSGVNVVRWDLKSTSVYTKDIFHTLVNMPFRRFILVFFSVFFAEFLFFASVYFIYPYHCIPAVHNFYTSLWFSLQTGLMLTFGGTMTPSPECGSLQSLVAVQALTSKVIEYVVLGICFCRFTSPEARKSGLLIANRLVLSKEPDGSQVLSCRVANVRKHQLLNSSIRLMYAFDGVDAGQGIEIEELALSMSNSPNALLWLPCIASHKIDGTSPLAGLDMGSEDVARRVEFMVVAEGVVAATGLTAQSSKCFTLDDVATHCRFSDMISKDGRSQFVVDFDKMSDVVFHGQV